MKKILTFLILLILCINCSIAENIVTIDKETLAAEDNQKIRSLVDYYITNKLFSNPLTLYDKQIVIGNSKKIDINKFFNENDSASSIRALYYDIYKLEKYDSIYSLDIAINSIYVYKEDLMKHIDNLNNLSDNDINKDRTLLRLYIKNENNNFYLLDKTIDDFDSSNELEGLNEFLSQILFKDAPNENNDNYIYCLDQLKKLMQKEDVDGKMIFFKNHLET